jgi:hypothetical protein
MSEGDGQVCCILGVCCPPAASGLASEAQRVMLAELLSRHATHRALADWLLDTFDFAPHGSLTHLKAELIRHARTRP